MTTCHVQGPVPLSSTAYAQRAFEAQLRQEITAGRWCVLLGPRQHGKTSGLLRLKVALKEIGLSCVIVDLQSLPPLTSYVQLLEWFAEKVAAGLDSVVADAPVGGKAQELAAWLSAAIPAGGAPVVLMVDEASGINDDKWRNSFYGQIRSLSNDRAEGDPLSLANRLCFVFAGTFRLEELVEGANSPFNVCVRIETDDLTLDSAKLLAEQILGIGGAPFAETVYRLVGGQPYLLQSALLEASQVPPELQNEAVEAGLKRLYDATDHHFERLFGRVIGDFRLTSIVRRMTAAGGKVSYEPASADFSFLQVLGIAIRSGKELIFRNALYADIAGRAPQLGGAAIGGPTRRAVLFPLPPGSFSFMKNPQLTEFVESSIRGAVNAYAHESYRLALTGFGAALEGLLLDYLVSLKSNVLGQAVAAAHVSWKNYERSTVPSTWRLVNMMAVTRKSRSLNPIEIPSLLRDWRNQVHPAVALNGYISEPDLEPCARASSGLFESVLHDVESAY